MHAFLKLKCKNLTLLGLLWCVVSPLQVTIKTSLGHIITNGTSYVHAVIGIKPLTEKTYQMQKQIQGTHYERLMINFATDSCRNPN